MFYKSAARPSATKLKPLKAQREMPNLVFVISEAQRNSHKELLDSAKAQRNFRNCKAKF